MKLNRNNIGKTWIPNTIAVCSAAVVYWTLSNMSGIGQSIQAAFKFVAPVLWGAVLAYIIDSLVVLIQKTIFRKAKRFGFARRMSIVLAVIVILVLLTLFSVALIPQLVSSATGLISNLGGYAASLISLLKTADIEIAGYHLDLSGLAAYGDTLLENLTTLLQENIGRIINTSFTIGKGFINGVISFILAVYFLLDKERIRHIAQKILHRRLSDDKYERVAHFSLRCHRILIRFIVCDLLDGLIVGIVNYIFMTICGMPYSVLISVVVAVTNLLPTFGPICGGFIGGFILLLVDPQYVLQFVIFTIILQLTDGYILKPRLYGNSMGMSPLWVLIVIIIGGRMFGAAGVALAIPLAAISDILFRDILQKWFDGGRAEPKPHNAVQEDEAALS